MATAGLIAVDLFLVTDSDFRRVSVVDVSAARSLPAAGLICPEIFGPDSCSIGFAIALPGSVAVVVAAAADSDLGRRNRFAIAVAGLAGSAPRHRLVVDPFSVAFVAAAEWASALVSDAASIARSSFELLRDSLWLPRSSDSVPTSIHNATRHRSDLSMLWRLIDPNPHGPPMFVRD